MTLWADILLGSGLLLGGLLCARLFLSYTAKRTRTRRAARRRLERALGIDRAQRRLLARLARLLGEEDHTCLLLGRGCFETAVSKVEVDHKALLRIERLRLQIFEGARRP